MSRVKVNLAAAGAVCIPIVSAGVLAGWGLARIIGASVLALVWVLCLATLRFAD